MSAKRNSRVIEDDIPQRHRGYSSAVASLDASRRTSRTSSIEDMQSVIAGMSAEAALLPTSEDFEGSEKTSITSKSIADRSDSTTTLSSAAGSSIVAEAGRMANFGVVSPGIYRSSYPLAEHFEFVQTLGLKTVVTLVQKDDERSIHLGTFVQENGIRHVVFNMQGTKKEDIPHHTMTAILEIVHDKSAHPLLIHCNQGKHRTGCVVAASRKVAGWSVDTVLEEYRSFAEPKVRDCDVAYITALEAASVQLRKSEVGVSSSFSSSYRSMRRRIFIRFVAITFATMVVCVCTPWRWN